MKKMVKQYLVIETGYEGIEKLCWLTENREYAISKREEFINKKVERDKELWKDYPEHRLKSRQEIANFFCIQEWTGKEFQCVCKELGVKVTKLMLR